MIGRTMYNTIFWNLSGIDSSRGELYDLIFAAYIRNYDVKSNKILRNYGYDPSDLRNVLGVMWKEIN